MKIKNIVKTIAVVSFGLAISGCHKMYFHNGANSAAPLTTKRLHHELVYELIEMSQPVNMSAMCGGKDWATVEVERTFLNGLITGLQPVYGQWTVQQACK